MAYDSKSNSESLQCRSESLTRAAGVYTIAMACHQVLALSVAMLAKRMIAQFHWLV